MPARVDFVVWSAEDIELTPEFGRSECRLGIDSAGAEHHQFEPGDDVWSGSCRYIAERAFMAKAKALGEIELRQLRATAKDRWTRLMLWRLLKNKACALAGTVGSNVWREPSF